MHCSSRIALLTLCIGALMTTIQPGQLRRLPLTANPRSLIARTLCGLRGLPKVHSGHCRGRAKLSLQLRFEARKSSLISYFTFKGIEIAIRGMVQCSVILCQPLDGFLNCSTLSLRGSTSSSMLDSGARHSINLNLDVPCRDRSSILYVTFPRSC